MFNRPLNESVEAKDGEAKDPKDAVHIVRDGKPQDVHVMIRGDVNNQGPVVERRFLQVFGEPMLPLNQGSGRANLAESDCRPEQSVDRTSDRQSSLESVLWSPAGIDTEQLWIARSTTQPPAIAR